MSLVERVELELWLPTYALPRRGADAAARDTAVSRRISQRVWRLPTCVGDRHHPIDSCLFVTNCIAYVLLGNLAAIHYYRMSMSKMAAPDHYPEQCASAHNGICMNGSRFTLLPSFLD